MLKGGLLPFPRTGCVPYANAILSCLLRHSPSLSRRELDEHLRRVARHGYRTLGAWLNTVVVIHGLPSRSRAFRRLCLWRATQPESIYEIGDRF